MTFKSSILVLANRTALSSALEAALTARAQAAPTMFTLVVPLGHSPDAQQQAQEMAATLAEAGLEIRGIAGDSDPLCAVVDVYSPAEYDEIIVSTLPASSSRWLRASVPQQIARHTGALVRHVEAKEMAHSARAVRPAA
jgi:nucleotide-binding universal stress UspA family protein